jgi:integrase
LGKEKEAAWRKWHEALAGEVDLSPSAKVLDLFEAFLQWSLKNHAAGTFNWHRKYLESFGRSIRPSLRINELKPLHLTTWLDKSYPKNTISDNTRNGAMRVVQRSLNWAVEQDIIQVSPLAKVRRPKTTPRDVYLEPEQYRALLAAINDEAFLDFVTVLRETGCRPLEARTVQIGHFDVGKRCWTIPKELAKGGLEIRTVLLNDRAFEISRKYALRNTEGALLRNFRGKPWSSDAITTRCGRLRKKLGFYVCPYAIRHTFATDAIIRGVDLVTIAQLMGHKNLQMLTRIYQHVSKRADHLREGLRKATEENAA